MNPFTSTFEIFSAVVTPRIVTSEADVENFPEADGAVKLNCVASHVKVVPAHVLEGVLVAVFTDHAPEEEEYTVYTFFSMILLSVSYIFTTMSLILFGRERFSSTKVLSSQIVACRLLIVIVATLSDITFPDIFRL